MRYQPHLKRIGPKHLILNNFPRYIKQDLSSRHVFAYENLKKQKSKYQKIKMPIKEKTRRKHFEPKLSERNLRHEPSSYFWDQGPL